MSKEIMSETTQVTSQVDAKPLFATRITEAKTVAAPKFGPEATQVATPKVTEVLGVKPTAVSKEVAADPANGKKN